MCTGIEVAALIGATLAVGTTAYAATKGGPDLPTIPKAPTPPPTPPPPAPLPAAPTALQADEGIAAQRRRAQQQFGVQQTLLTSPLGDTPPLTTTAQPATGTRRTLGGSN